MEKRNKTLSNIQRILTQMEKTINRLRRQNYFFPKQCHPLLDQIENAINLIHGWIKDFKIFSGLDSLFVVLSLGIKKLGELINWLSRKIKPVSGKKRIKKARQEKDRRKIFNAVDRMIDHIAELINDNKQKETEIAIELEKSILKAFEKYCMREFEKTVDHLETERGEKTIIFPWHDQDGYEEFVEDSSRFKSFIMQYLKKNNHITGHKSDCTDHTGYRLCGFRSKQRKTRTTDGKKKFRIRLVQCLNCRQKFSIVPSFLPREKHFSLNIMGQVLENMLRFSMSIQGALQSLNLCRKPVKSKQTILNWLQWIGTLHPAVVLTRAGITGSGYLQEDEGFEKEPNLRTYSVIMVDPANLLVWHSDYVDSVDEDTLVFSFEKFLEKIEFKILGVTKDKWLASTNALKKVFKNLWVGFCTRHYLKKLYRDLIEYGKKTDTSQKQITYLYRKIKKIMKTSSSEMVLNIRLDNLDDDAFNHPLLKARLDSLKENAVHYTCSNRRKGITPTTSIVDNFLKTVKRKLRQVESFRDPMLTKCVFQAMGNVRNFLPFLSGAKNAHKSPFMLAKGETFNLPWIQTMNVHNAFLFSQNAC